MTIMEKNVHWSHVCIILSFNPCEKYVIILLISFFVFSLLFLKKKNRGLLSEKDSFQNGCCQQIQWFQLSQPLKLVSVKIDLLWKSWQLSFLNSPFGVCNNRISFAVLLLAIPHCVNNKIEIHSEATPLGSNNFNIIRIW